MGNQTFFLGLALGTLLLPVSGRPGELNRFGGLELFLDDEMISWSQNIRRQVLSPSKFVGNPVVRPEFPWEEEFTTISGTVLWDDQKRLFRMWYNAYGKDYKNQQYLAYAESPDGFQWQKPQFDLVTYGTYVRTNILLGGDVNIHGPCVLLNPVGGPAERYLMIFDSYTNKRPGSAESKLAGRAVYAATSADGIHFTPKRGRMIILGKSDTGHSAVWNPERGRFQLFLRGVNEYADEGGLRQRVRYVRMSESADGRQWDPPIELMKSDEVDGAPDSQFHQMTVTRYGNLYVGLLTLFRIRSLDLDGKHRGEKGLRLEHGVTETQLVTSRDGLHWTRVANRQIFLPLGAPGQWDGGWIVTSSEFVVRNGEVRIYYGGSPGRFSRGTTQIGVASLPLDRFVGMKPARLNAEAILELKPYRYFDDVCLNATVAVGGEIRAELLDFDGNVLRGYGRESFAAIRSTALDHPLVWGYGGHEKRLPVAARDAAIRIRFYIRNAQLHSLRSMANRFGMKPAVVTP